MAERGSGFDGEKGVEVESPIALIINAPARQSSQWTRSTPQTKEGLPKALSQADIKKLFSVPDITDPLGIRDRAILETLYATGARRTELTNLKMSDLDLNRQTMLIERGKGGIVARRSSLLD